MSALSNPRVRKRGRLSECEVAFGADQMSPATLAPAAWRQSSMGAEDVYLMFPSAHYHYPEPPEGDYPNDSVPGVRFAVSRDGVRWSGLTGGRT